MSHRVDPSVPSSQFGRPVNRRESLKWLGLAGVGATVGLAGRSLHAEPAQVVPVMEAGPAVDRCAMQGGGYYATKVGRLEVTLLSDGGFPMDATQILPKTEATSIDEAGRQAFVDPRALPGHVNCMLIKSPTGTILIDTGCGDGFGPTTGKLPGNLKRLGFEPSDITHVILTHLHPDHTGGLASFAAARIVMHRREHDFWAGDADLSRSLVGESFKSMMPRVARAAIASAGDRLQLLDGAEAEVAPGVRLIAAPGHTPGHVAVEVADAGQSLLYISDALHMPSLQMAHPEWQVAFDADPIQAIDARKRLLDRAVTDRVRVAGAHLAFPGFGHVARNGSGYHWVPEVWQWATT